MKGVYQHCSERHLHRYLSEFDFRYSNRVRLGIDDVERTERALMGIVEKQKRTPKLKGKRQYERSLKPLVILVAMKAKRNSRARLKRLCL